MDPYALTPPVTGTHLPGGGCVLSVDERPEHLPHARIRTLHGALSRALGAAHGERMGSQRVPDWSLVPWPASPIGWAVYWRTDAGCALANRAAQVRLFDRDVTLRFGPLARVKAPSVPPHGRRLLHIEALTPVCGVEPTSKELFAALARGFPKRLGLSRFDDTRIVIERISDETRVVVRDLGLHGERHRVVGWTGSVVVATNAVGHWFLEAAARGPGLGGRVAFGFGAVRVTRWG